MIKNIKKLNRKINESQITYALVLWFFVIAMCVMLDYFETTHSNSNIDYVYFDFERIVNIAVASISSLVGIIVSYIIVARLKVRSIVLIGVFIILGLSFVFVYTFLILPIYRSTPSDPDYITSQSFFIRNIVNGSIVGFVLGFISFWSLVRSRTIFPFVIIFFIIFGSLPYSTKYEWPIQIANLVTILVVFVIVASQFLNIHKIKPKRKRKSVNFMFWVLLILASLIIGYFVYDYTNKLVDRRAFIEKIREYQWDNRDTSGGGSDDHDQGVLRVFEPSNDVYVAGFYKADSPKYLKFDVFDVDVSPYEFGTSSRYPYYTYESDFDRLPYDSDSIELETIKMIYKKNDEPAYPTAENVLVFDDMEFDLFLGLLKNPHESEDGMYFVEYQVLKGKDSYNDAYTVFTKYLDYMSSDYINVTDYTYVSTASERYDEIEDLSENITAGDETDLEKAASIEKYFHENYYYNFNPGIDDQENPIDDFILDKKEGYCAHFAAGMVTMLETVDVDARLVGGFYSDTYSERMDAYAMLSQDLHAWVEVYDKYQGWVIFDPTSSVLSEECSCTGSIPGPNGTEIDEDDLDFYFEGVNPVLSFEDIFEEESVEGLEELNPPDDETVSAARERLQDEMEQAEESISRWMKLIKILNVLRLLSLGLIVILVFAGCGVLMAIIIKRQMNSDKRRLNIDRKKAREIDEKLRNILIKKYNLEDIYSHVSSKRFWEKLTTLELSNKQLKELRRIYEKINRILYASEYNRELIVELKNSFKKFGESFRDK